MIPHNVVKKKLKKKVLLSSGESRRTNASGVRSMVRFDKQVLVLGVDSVSSSKVRARAGPPLWCCSDLGKMGFIPMLPC